MPDSTWQLPALKATQPDDASSSTFTVPLPPAVPPLPPGTDFDTVYKLVVLVDTMERFSEHDLPGDAEVRTLPVGDFMWVARCRAAVPGGPALGAHRLQGCRLRLQRFAFCSAWLGATTVTSTYAVFAQGSSCTMQTSVQQSLKLHAQGYQRINLSLWS